MGNLMNTYEDAIPVAFPPQTPLIIGFDNINIYKDMLVLRDSRKAWHPLCGTLQSAWRENLMLRTFRTSGRTSTQSVNDRKMCCH